MTSLPLLSPRERLILTYLDRSSPLIEIGSTLFVTRNTVKTQVRAIYAKLGVHSRAEAVARARELGLLPAAEPGSTSAEDAPTDDPFPEQRAAASGAAPAGRANHASRITHASGATAASRTGPGSDSQHSPAPAPSR